MTPEQIVDKWPNLGMECDEDELISDIRQAITEAIQAERTRIMEGIKKIPFGNSPTDRK